MTEPRYYSSTAALRELLESDAIDANSKASIRLEILHRESVCIPVKVEHVDTLRHSLMLAMQGLSATRLDLVVNGGSTAAETTRFVEARAHVEEMINVLDSWRVTRPNSD